nr:hypothetical protein [uncultured Rhodoferax sp.]
MLVAEEYPKRPNGQDFLKPDPQTGKLREVYYMSKFGRNMTVVVDSHLTPGQGLDASTKNAAGD